MKKRPSGFDKAAVSELEKDWEGQCLLDAFSNQELYELVMEYKRIKKAKGIKEAQEYLNQMAKKRMEN